MSNDGDWMITSLKSDVRQHVGSKQLERYSHSLDVAAVVMMKKI